MCTSAKRNIETVTCHNRTPVQTKKKNVVKLCAYRIKLFQLGGWIISYGYYLIMFHSRVSDCKAHVCGQCLINGRQLHDIMRKGSYLLAIVKTER